MKKTPFRILKRVYILLHLYNHISYLMIFLNISNIILFNFSNPTTRSNCTCINCLYSVLCPAVKSVFEHVILNVRNDYNKHSRAFRAPASGIYVLILLFFLVKAATWQCKFSRIVRLFKLPRLVLQPQ